MAVKRGTIQVFSLLLAILYIGASSHLEALHSFVGHHDVPITHTDEQEKDPCHRLIYHHDVENGCHHHAHYTGHEKCQLCNLAFHGDQMLWQAVTIQSFAPAKTIPGPLKKGADTYLASISSPRAPPARH
jgi:hypothetical protein